MRPFLSFKRQTHILEWTANTGQNLIAWACCPRSYLLGRQKKSLYFRLTSGQTSGEKKFLKFFIGSKEPPWNFRGTIGGSIFPRAPFYSPKSRITPSCLLKDKKGRICYVAVWIQSWQESWRTRVLCSFIPGFNQRWICQFIIRRITDITY